MRRNRSESGRASDRYKQGYVSYRLVVGAIKQAGRGWSSRFPVAVARWKGALWGLMTSNVQSYCHKASTGSLVSVPTCQTKSHGNCSASPCDLSLSMPLF